MSNPITPTVVEKLVTTDTSSSSLVVGGASPVATTGTGGINAGAILGNTSISDSVGALSTVRAGGIGIASQTALDMIYASSASQFARVANGTTGQVWSATTSAAPSWKTNPFALLYGATGSTPSVVGAGALDAFAMTGLTTKDALLVVVQVGNPTGNSGANAITLQNTTDSIQLAALSSTGGNSSWFTSFALISADGQDSNAKRVSTLGIRGANIDVAVTSTVTLTTAWTGSWTIALYTAGVGAGTQTWTWRVYKLAGQ